MPIEPSAAKHFKGFSKLTREQRFAKLVEMGALSNEDIDYLQSGGIQSIDLAENLIENVIGYFQIPLGVATNFNIDGEDYLIPMAVEETSIIAAASKTAKWIRESGSITTEIVGENIIGQVQVAHLKNFNNFKDTIIRNKAYLIHLANDNIAKSMATRGGGLNDIQIRHLQNPDGSEMAVVHLLLNPCDAMGANLITQICEYLKTPIEDLTGETVTMCILSNLSDTKLTRAKVVINHVEEAVGQGIENASLFAESDPYRACTHNKGVLNGIDSVLLATGNDWRAVEAGIHAYAVRNGQYQAITKWRYANHQLTGTFEAPLMVGTIGGVTRLHPTAQLCLQILGINKANELARVTAAVGLVQNLGAINALTTVGLIQGHMKLHISNLALSTDANDSERPLLQQRLEEFFKRRKRITLQNAIDLLNEIRGLNIA